MAEAKKPKKNQTPRPKGNKRSKGLAEPLSKHGALIRFPEREAELRAIMILGEVQRPYHGFPDEQCGVRYLLTNDHLKVLRDQNIPFEILA